MGGVGNDNIRCQKRLLVTTICGLGGGGGGAASWVEHGVLQPYPPRLSATVSLGMPTGIRDGYFGLARPTLRQ